MPGNFKKEDLRITKTIKALRDAMLTLLSTHNFNRITVHDLCEEALISRATFYAHFYDKYDLLSYVFKQLLESIINEADGNFIEIEINKKIQKNFKIVKNIVENADAEVLELLHSFMNDILEAYIMNKKNTVKKIDLKNADYIVLCNFFSGGMISLLQRQVKNNLPLDFHLINVFLPCLVEYIAEWDVKQKI